MAETETAALARQQTASHSGEQQWLVLAAAESINQVLAGEDFNAELIEEMHQYQASGRPEQLINKASGIVALVGLYHVMEGKVTAREVLEATPSLVIDTAMARLDSESEYTSNLADAAESLFSGPSDSLTPEIDLNEDKALPPMGPTKKESLQRMAERAINGDAHAVNEVIAECGSIARAIVYGLDYYLLNGGDEDDLCQEALIGIVQGIELYDPAKMNFRNFAFLVIKRRIFSAIIASKRLKHGILNDAMSLDMPLPDQHDTASTTLGDIIADPRPGVDSRLADLEFYREMSHVFKRLSDMERQCTRLFLQGESYQYIADAVRTDPKSVDNALQRAKRKISQSMDLNNSR